MIIFCSVTIRSKSYIVQLFVCVTRDCVGTDSRERVSIYPSITATTCVGLGWWLKSARDRVVHIIVCVQSTQSQETRVNVWLVDQYVWKRHGGDNQIVLPFCLVRPKQYARILSRFYWWTCKHLVKKLSIVGILYIYERLSKRHNRRFEGCPRRK